MQTLTLKLRDEVAFRAALLVEWFRITVLRERCEVCQHRATTLLYDDGPARPAPVCDSCFDLIANRRRPHP
jgi:hypothetical protein